MTAQLNTVVGTAAGGHGALVEVGTERDLPGPASVDLAVVVDADAWTFAPHYRAGEEALHLLTRLAGTVRRGPTNRMVVQTSQPDHGVYESLRRGDPSEFLRSEVAARVADGFPPAGQLVAIEVSDGVADVDSDIRGAVDADGVVFGPAPVGDQNRWLVQGADLQRFKIVLRPLVQAWRDAKIRVRIDADPLDL